MITGRETARSASEVRARAMLPAKYEDIYRLIDTLGEYETVSSFAEAK